MLEPFDPIVLRLLRAGFKVSAHAYLYGDGPERIEVDASHSDFARLVGRSADGDLEQALLELEAQANAAGIS